jgi:hypothetical protein
LTTSSPSLPVLVSIDTAATNVAAVALSDAGVVLAEGGWGPHRGSNDFLVAQSLAGFVLGFVDGVLRDHAHGMLGVCYEDTRFGTAGRATTGLLRGILFTEILHWPHPPHALFAVSPSRWRSYHGVSRVGRGASKLDAYRLAAWDLGFTSDLDTSRKRADATAAFLIGRLGLPAWDARRILKAGDVPGPAVPEMARRIAVDDKLWIRG